MISQFERSVLQLVQLISAIKFVMLLQDPTQSPMEKRHRLSRFRVFGFALRLGDLFWNTNPRVLAHGEGVAVTMWPDVDGEKDSSCGMIVPHADRQPAA